MEPNLPKETDQKFQEYRKFVFGLECTKNEDTKTRLDHAITGLVTESGELAGLMKKIKFYKATIPRITFLDELGDLFWYLTAVLNTFEITLEDLYRLNMTKLKTRYPNNVFAEKNALDRDKNKEQEAVKEKLKQTDSSEMIADVDNKTKN